MRVRRVRMYEEMVKREERHALELLSRVVELENVVVRELIRGIALDSQKHAYLYRSIISLIKGESRVITEEEYTLLEEAFQRHVEVEGRMMERVKGLLEGEEDVRVRHLLIEIYRDERRHHTLMRNLLGAVIRREALLEEDVWDMIWRDVPAHGAPMG